MKVPFVDLSWQETQIREERERRFADIISRTAFIGGSEVQEFEDKFAAYCGVEHAISVANGTDSLALMYQALGIKAGDEIITIPNTFIASVSPLIHLGARPVFVDIDPITRNFDFKELELAITPNTKAILAVDLYGDMPDMDILAAIVQKHKLLLIEDACQAHGASYKGKMAGSFGMAAAFSFYPGKNLGAYGDGGAVTTNDEPLALRLRMLRNHGGVKKYEHSIAGYNSRLDTLQAGVLLEKLKYLSEWNEQRRHIADQYLKAFADLPMGLPTALSDVTPVWHLFVIQVPSEERNKFMDSLAKQGIATGIHYPIPLHQTEAFESLGYHAGDFPVAEKFASGCVSLPIYPGMTDAQAESVIAAVRHYFNG